MKLKFFSNTFNFKWWVYLTVIIFGLFHLLIAILDHYYFRTFTYDYGVYNFAFYHFAHVAVPPVPMYKVFVPYPIHFLQDHFSLSLILLSPLYWITANVFGSYLLLIIQWAFVLFGGWCTFKLIYHKFQNTTFALLAFVYYFVLYGRYSSYQSDCNLAIIGAAMLPAFFYFFEIKHMWGTLISFVFLVLNREDLPLCLFFICLYLLLAYRKEIKQVKLAGWLAAFSLIAFVLIMQVIIPALEDENKKFGLFEYTALGSSPGGALTYILLHPIKTLSYLFVNHSGDHQYDKEKISFYVLYGLSGGLLLIFRPAYFICFIPILAKKMFNDNPVRWGYEMYYSIEIASLLPIFVFSIIGDLKWPRLRVVLAAMLCISTFTITTYAIRISFNSGLGNYKYNVFSSDFYKLPPGVVQTHALLDLIPANAAVCASGDLIPHLAQRDKIYYYPSVNDADYLCVNTGSNTYPVSREEFDKRLNEMLRSPDWHLLAVSGKVMLLKKSVNLP